MGGTLFASCARDAILNSARGIQTCGGNTSHSCTILSRARGCTPCLPHFLVLHRCAWMAGACGIGHSIGRRSMHRAHHSSRAKQMTRPRDYSSIRSTGQPTFAFCVGGTLTATSSSHPVLPLRLLQSCLERHRRASPLALKTTTCLFGRCSLLALQERNSKWCRCTGAGLPCLVQLGYFALQLLVCG